VIYWVPCGKKSLLIGGKLDGTASTYIHLYTSDIVIEEAGKDVELAVARRLEALAGIPLLAITDDVLALSEKLIQAGAVPRKAIGDSLHIALSTVHGLDYLLTWNYRHIDNAETKPLIRSVCLTNRYVYPEYVHLKNSWG